MSEEVEEQPRETKSEQRQCQFREHGRLTEMLALFPTQTQKGIFGNRIDYTCIDVIPEYIIVGTDVGTVLLYDRVFHQMHKLDCKTKSGQITCIRIQNGGDYVVAAGTSKGLLIIFVLPSYLPGRTRQLQLFLVDQLHQSTVTSIAWSPNGMRVFTGDTDGAIVCTELEYTKSRTRSFLLSQEPHPIVQLDYHQMTLLIASEFRCVLLFVDENNRKVQVGSKDRKVLGSYGAVFLPELSRPDMLELYTSRPGLRIWRAGIDGSVRATYIFRNLLNGSTPLIPVLADTIHPELWAAEGNSPDCAPGSHPVEMPTKSDQPPKITEKNFAKLRITGPDNKHLITWSDGALYILSPEDGDFVGWRDGFGDIVDVAVTDQEIYILRKNGPRRIIRIATNRDPLTEEMDPPASQYEKDMSSSVHAPAAGVASQQDSPRSASPVTTLKLTANKVSQGIKKSLKEVGDRLHEGQKPTTLPPWGVAPPVKARDESPVDDVEDDLDSCQEARSSSSTVSTPNDDNNDESCSNAASSTANSQTSQSVISATPATKSHDTSRESSREHSSPIATHLSTSHHDSIEHNLTRSATGAGQGSFLGRDAVLVKSKQPKDRTASAGSNVDIPDDSDVIAVRVKPKKHKKKKHKLLKDKDTDSICSVNSDSGNGTATDTKENNGLATTHISVQPPPSPTPSPSTQLGTGPLDVTVLAESRSPSTGELRESHFTNISKIADSVHRSVEVEKSTDACDKEGSKDTSKVDDLALTPPDDLSAFVSSILADHRQELMSNSVTSTTTDPEELVRSSSSHKSESDQISKAEQTGSVSAKSSEENVPAEKRVLKSVIPLKLDLPAHSKRHPSSQSSECVTTSASASSSSGARPKGDSRHASTQQEAMTVDSMYDSIYKNTGSEYDLHSYTKAAPPAKLVTSPQHPSQTSSAKSSPSSEDFYSRYLGSSATISPEDEAPNMKEEESERGTLEDVVTYHSVMTSGSSGLTDSGQMEDDTGEDPMQVYAANTWTEFLAPGNLQSMALSACHIWCVDKSDRLHYSALAGPGLKWHKVEEPAKQVAVSPSGSILWRLYRGSVFAATKITPRAPAGLKWVEAAREVMYISVDNKVAWYIKTNGNVMMQKNLSRERPCFRTHAIPCTNSCIQIVCCNNVVWALTEARKILVRYGITKDNPEGDGWGPLEGAVNNASLAGEELLASQFTICEDGKAWMIDVVGRVWFTLNVTRETPCGSKQWWQTSMSEYLMQDSTALDMLKTVAEFPQNFSKIITTADRGGIIAASGQNGVWVCPSAKHILHVCRGSMLGHRWMLAAPSGMAPSAVWSRLSAMAATSTDGLIWAQLPSGSLFCFSPQSRRPTEISFSGQGSFASMCATQETVWVLLNDGKIYIRTGMGHHCPQGVAWTNLDLTQLGGTRLTCLSCGTQNVWAVASSGNIYLRIGIKAPSKNFLNPAWVPVDGTTHTAGAKFIKVVTGPMDWIVWAIDSKRCVYVRRGITDSMPIGTHWVYVSGTPGIDLCISEQFVYTLSPNGEVLLRYGITQDNITGDYWKKIPGAFQTLSVTPDDDLWGINMEGQLCHRSTHFISRQKKALPGLRGMPRSTSLSEDWEVL